MLKSFVKAVVNNDYFSFPVFAFPNQNYDREENQRLINKPLSSPPPPPPPPPPPRGQNAEKALRSRKKLFVCIGTLVTQASLRSKR